MTKRGYGLGSFCSRMLGWTLVPSLLLAAPAVAKLIGPYCVDCHTMHYSQDGGVLSEWGSAGPYEALLTSDCLGCHTGVNADGGKTPFVFSTSAPTYSTTGTEAGTDTLAGGNFYWVSAVGSTRGHNVAGVGAADALLTPPGFTGAATASDGSSPGGGSWPSGQRVTCAGTYGCHGTHAASSATTAVRGGHHLGASAAITAPGTTPAGGYRMLVGIAGYEDSDWEFRPTTSAHNQYKGDTSKGNSSISALCGRCHGNFHSVAGTGSSTPWLRHPVDYDMGSTAVGSEYRSYGGAGVNAYVLAAPVASSNVGSVKSSVTFSGDTIVTCVSCHRAHGSPYYKMLRWNYAGSISTGCAYCHTTKN